MPSTEPITPSRWVESYADALFNYALVRVNDREAARDLVQETFLSALQNVGSFRGESSEKTWLFAILKNKNIDLRGRGDHVLLLKFETPEIEAFAFTLG